MNALEGLASTFTVEEKLEARDLEVSIQTVSRVINEQKKSLDSNFVRLGQLINRVRQQKYWLLGEHKSFGDYIEDCSKKIGIGHSQLYVYMNVSRNLLPSVSEEALVEIGVTKAGVLSKYVDQSGQSVIPDEIMEVAKDPTKKTDELDALVNSRLHNVIPEKGTWVSLGGFFADESEKAEWQDAIDLAKAVDPAISATLPPWMQLKESVLRLAREFLSTYSGG